RTPRGVAVTPRCFRCTVVPAQREDRYTEVKIQALVRQQFGLITNERRLSVEGFGDKFHRSPRKQKREPRTTSPTPPTTSSRASLEPSPRHGASVHGDVADDPAVDAGEDLVERVARDRQAVVLLADDGTARILGLPHEVGDRRGELHRAARIVDLGR